MAALTVLAIAAVGVAVGLLSGLVGIGGGVLIVPFLYFFYDYPQLFGVAVPPDVRTVLAHGTSLFIILPTSASGALAYHRAGLVEWRAVVPIGLASAAAAIVGARIALAMPPELLKLCFGALLILAGVRLAMRRLAPSAELEPAEPRVSLPVTVSIGIVVGLFSAMLGVGGGIVAIPLLMHVVRLDVRRVAATSMGVIAITAAAGSLSYMWSGWGVVGLPPWSIGYVHVSAGLAMCVGALASVRWGAALNQRLHPRTLTLVFAVLFTVLGLRLVMGNAGQLMAS
jgi:uncharacterized membrane protein YfcA